MNWTNLFKSIEQNLDLDELLDIVSENGTYKDTNEISPNENIEISYINDKIAVGTIYYGGGKELFKILFASELISIGKARLLNFIESEILKNELFELYGDELKFFDYEFMINMHLSADISSGQTYFKKSLSELESAIHKSPIYLNSKVKTYSITELNETLKTHIYGFKGKIEDYK